MRIEPYFVVPEKFDVHTQILNESKKKKKKKKNCNCKCKCSEVLPEQKCCNENYSKRKVAKPITQIIDNTDRMEYSRTEQLALPSTRQLSELRKRPAFQDFDEVRKSQVNRIYRKSLLSLYSRLANVKPKEKPEPPPPKMDEEVRKRMMQRLTKLSKPKKDIIKPVPKPSKSKGSYRSLTNGKQPNKKRLEMLSKPKKYPEIKTNQWCLTKAMKYYKPTERLINLSKPKTFEKPDFEIMKVTSEALAYKATTRIKKLATPAKFNVKANSEDALDPFKPNPKALKATSSKRVRELAIPKQSKEPPINLDPYHVSKTALKAKTTARIKALAQPKTYKT